MVQSRERFEKTILYSIWECLVKTTTRFEFTLNSRPIIRTSRVTMPEALVLCTLGAMPHMFLRPNAVAQCRFQHGLQTRARANINSVSNSAILEQTFKMIQQAYGKSAVTRVR